MAVSTGKIAILFFLILSSFLAISPRLLSAETDLITDAECGPACLYVLLSFLDVECDDFDTFSDSFTLTTKGLSIADLENAASRRGVELIPLSLSYSSLMQSCETAPVIAHFTDGHFVVVQRVGDQAVELYDPLFFQRMSRQEFEDQWSGVILSSVKIGRPTWHYLSFATGIVGFLFLVVGAVKMYRKHR